MQIDTRDAPWLFTGQEEHRQLPTTQLERVMWNIEEGTWKEHSIFSFALLERSSVTK